MSLGFFTAPYPDELLYSACARYSDRTDYPNKADALDEIFGGKCPSAIIDLPTKLDHLVSVLPQPCTLTALRFITDHTLAPFYTPFIPNDRKRLLYKNMRGAAALNVKPSLGITAGRIKLPTWLRYCPICVNEDRGKFRETYWHRVHQLSGIEVCPHHAVHLENSSVPWRGRSSSRRFHTAEHTIQATPPRRLNPSNPEHSILLKIAQNAAWLVSWRGHGLGIDILRDRYHNLLLERGYAYYNGWFRTRKLLEDFVKFYSEDFLMRYHSPVPDDRSWLVRMLIKNKVNVVQHPLRHLLLITFMGCSAEQIFTDFKEYKPFGDGPWPCLNTAADHFKQPMVEHCRLMNSHQSGTDLRPVDIFTCSCGFIYTRIGADTTPADRFKIYQVSSYGHVWEEALRQKWEDRSITQKDIAKYLNVAENTAKRHAIRLNLSYPRNSQDNSDVRQADIHTRFRIKRMTFQEALPVRRQEWLAVLEANPNASRMELEEKAQYIYYWLKKYDLQWFEAHLPPRKMASLRGDNLDWRSIDMDLSESIKTVAARIKNQPGRPIRVSITRIIREVGKQSWLQKRLSKLPLTAQTLSEHIESIESFSFRLIVWAETHFRSEGKCPSRTRFEMKAYVRNKTGRTLPVQSAVDKAMERLLEDLN